MATQELLIMLELVRLLLLRNQRCRSSRIMDMGLTKETDVFVRKCASGTHPINHREAIVRCRSTWFRLDVEIEDTYGDCRFIFFKYRIS